MDYLQVSIFVKKDIASIVLMRGGMLIKKHVFKIKDASILSSPYLCLISTIKESFRHVRAYVEDNKECDVVSFEINNSTVAKWIYNCYSKDDYQDEFSQMLDLLNELPICYDFCVTPKPKAYLYAQEKYITTGLKMSGLEV